MNGPEGSLLLAGPKDTPTSGSPSFLSAKRDPIGASIRPFFFFFLITKKCPQIGCATNNSQHCSMMTTPLVDPSKGVLHKVR